MTIHGGLQDLVTVEIDDLGLAMVKGEGFSCSGVDFNRPFCLQSLMIRLIFEQKYNYYKIIKRKKDH